MPVRVPCKTEGCQSTCVADHRNKSGLCLKCSANQKTKEWKERDTEEAKSRPLCTNCDKRPRRKTLNTCQNCATKSWRERTGRSNQSRTSGRIRSDNLKRFYGLTETEYDEMWQQQNGLCKICQRPEKEGRSLAIDHCHETGYIRGLLCQRCNRGLGQFNDKLKLLQAACQYMQQAFTRKIPEKSINVVETKRTARKQRT